MPMAQDRTENSFLSTGHLGAGDRVLVLAPYGGDGPVLRRTLSGAGLRVEPCGDAEELCREIRLGAAACLLAEEALTQGARKCLTEALAHEPTWSDLPLLILLLPRAGRRDDWLVARGIEGTSHLSLLERPLRTAALISVVRLAVEARRKQYQVRDELASRERTQQKLDERARIARRQLAEIEAIYRSAPVGLCVFDKHLRYVRINDRLAKINGVSVAAHLGRTPAEIVPDLAYRAEAVYGQIMETKQPVIGLELEGVTPARPGVVRTWLESWFPLADARGEVAAFNVVVQEITERKAMEKELRLLNEELERRVEERTAALSRSEAEYRSLVENTQDIPFNLDAAGRIRYLGPQVERYGFQSRLLRGRHFLQLVFSGDRKLAAAAFRKMLTRGEPLPVSFRIRAADGGVHWLEQRGVLLRDASGEVTGITGVLRDITARKELEERQAGQRDRLRKLAARLASAQEEEQRRIAQGLHDDVAQLLAACGVKLTLAGTEPREARRRALHEEVQALLRQASGKLQSLSFELYSSALRRVGLGPGLLELCEVMSRRYHMSFTLQGGDVVGKLEEDTEVILFKSVRELLFNVVKHAGVQEASVSLSRTQERLRVAVEDCGRGFPEGGIYGKEPDLAQGLGLFAIQERLNSMGGTIRIESKPHVKTRVTVSVPLHPPSARS
jgi:PAS domain S-box-containing protein